MFAANPLVSIIIVTYNSADILPRCLAALAETTYAPFEIIIVDNHSADETRALVEARGRGQRAGDSGQGTAGRGQGTGGRGQGAGDRGQRAGRQGDSETSSCILHPASVQITLIHSAENLGFGRACNLGAEAAHGEFLVFLNPDVVAVPDWLEKLVACALAHPNALISPQTLFSGDMLRPAPEWVSEEAALPGAALLAPRTVWRQLGGFDPHFFLYWEDTELCWRAWLLGVRVLADHRSYVFHQRGGSTGGARWDAERAKNSLRTYLKLMRWRIALPFLLLLALKTMVKLALRRDPAVLMAWQWNWRNLGLTLAERRAILSGQKGDPAHLERLIRAHERRMRHERTNRILHSSSFHPSASPSKPLLLYITDATALGGAEGYLETLLLHANQVRYRVALAIPPREATQPLVERAQAHGVEVHYLDAVHHEGMNAQSVLRAYTLFTRLRPAIAHFVLASPRRCAESMLAAWLARVPQRIATFQLATPVPHFAGLVGVARALNRSMQFRALTQGVAVSRGNARLLIEQYGFPAAQLAMIPNSVDTRAFASAKNRAHIRAEWHVPADAPLVGVVGRLSHQKGHRVLFAALPVVWARFPNVHIALIGAGELEQELRAEAARIDARDRIHFLGQIARDHMPAALAALDLFVLPSLYEGLPFAVVEAMAAARPIVATDVDGTREAISHERTGLLVPPGAPEPLAHALLRLLGDPEFGRKLGAAAQAQASERFDQADMLQATFGLYGKR